MSKGEWGIRDENSGLWFLGFGCDGDSPRWGDYPIRYTRYGSAAAAVNTLNLPDDSARILSAPQRPPMTDAEAETWLSEHPLLMLSWWQRGHEGSWAIYEHDRTSCPLVHVSVGGTMFDAIRAARRALEKRP